MAENPSANAANTGGGKSPFLIKKTARQPTPGFLPGKSHEQRSLVGYSPKSHKESDTAEETEDAYTKKLTGCLCR